MKSNKYCRELIMTICMALFVIGYTGTNINYYDPETDKISTVTFEKADEMFQLGGNKFITYLWR